MLHRPVEVAAIVAIHGARFNAHVTGGVMRAFFLRVFAKICQRYGVRVDVIVMWCMSIWKTAIEFLEANHHRQTLQPVFYMA